MHGRHEAARFLRYLDAQDAATYQTANALGWQDGVGFLTHEGVITAGGVSEHLDTVPHPLLVNRAPYHYGFGDEGRAVDALTKLLRMHDETVCSLAGSWLVACLLAQGLRRYTKSTSPTSAGKARRAPARPAVPSVICCSSSRATPKVPVT